MWYAMYYNFKDNRLLTSINMILKVIQTLKFREVNAMLSKNSEQIVVFNHMIFEKCKLKEQCFPKTKAGKIMVPER